MTLTGPAMRGHYRTLRLGQRDFVAIGPPVPGNLTLTSPLIELMRGVSNNDFAVSLYAHGPEPLVPLIVLGRATYLYPSADTGMTVPYVPFASGADRVSDACSRWELRGAVSDVQLAAFASAIRPG
jgi:hypothetical protein